MKCDELTHQLRTVLEKIEVSRRETIQAHEKFKIALTGILRLLSGERATLVSLRGSPDDLKAVLIRELIQLEEHTTETFSLLEKMVANIITELRKQ